MDAGGVMTYIEGRVTNKNMFWGIFEDIALHTYFHIYVYIYIDRDRFIVSQKADQSEGF